MTEETKKQLFIHHFFGNGVYKFHLRTPQMKELEGFTGVGIGAIYKRVVTGAYYATDISQLVRLGLVGGGSGVVGSDDVLVTDRMAADLVATYLEAMPMADRWAIASACIAAAMIGVDPVVDEVN